MELYKPKTIEELKGLVDNYSIGLGNIDTSLIDDMTELFKDSIRKDFSGIENWDVSNVVVMTSMFENCTHFNADLSNWNTKSLEYADLLFSKCPSFTSDLSSWEVLMF